MIKGKYDFKTECLYLQRFHGRFLHFDIGVKEKPQNVRLKLIFAMCSTDLRELLFRINFSNENVQEIKIFICHRSFITLAQERP